MPTEDWGERPLTELLDHLLREYHAPIEGELRAIREAVRAAAAACADGPGRFTELIREVDELAEELANHVAKEEAVLFPWIRSGRGALAGAPIRVMMLEHADADARVARINMLLPCVHKGGGDACAALRDCFATFSSRLAEHMRLENEVLFPRALRGSL